MAADSGRPSASGARVTGDDLQYAVAWHAALRTLVPHSGANAVTVEAVTAGNVDDVVIGKAHGPDDYMQVKASVTAEKAATIEWLTALSGKRGPSILQRFYRTSQQLRVDGAHPRLTLVTNRSIHPDDPVLTLRDRNDHLADRLCTATNAATAAGRRNLLRHLDCTDDELYEFLSNLRLHTDASEAAWRDYHIRDISHAAGVQADEVAYRLGIAEVREWVKTSRSQKRPADIAAAIDRLGIRAQEPFTMVAINALDEGFTNPDARVTLDWVDRFRGSEARSRRGLKNPKEWETVLRPQLIDAQRTLRSLGAKRILITGTMRLPTWFTAAVMFQETAGFIPAKTKDGQLWLKPGGTIMPASICLSSSIAELRPGSEVALALAISADLTPDVTSYIASTGRDIPIITISLPSGISGSSIADRDHAYAVALAVRDLSRQIARRVNPPILHLFMAAPSGFAVLLGGVWDRVPATQTYEDLAASGYEPAFFLPN